MAAVPAAFGLAAIRAAVAEVRCLEMTRWVAVPVVLTPHGATAQVHYCRGRAPLSLLAVAAAATTALLRVFEAATNEGVGHERSDATAVGCQSSETFALGLRNVLGALAVLHEGYFALYLEGTRQAFVHLGI